jgi:hypothetical protein
MDTTSQMATSSKGRPIPLGVFSSQMSIVTTKHHKGV